MHVALRAPWADVGRTEGAWIALTSVRPALNGQSHGAAVAMDAFMLRMRSATAGACRLQYQRPAAFQRAPWPHGLPADVVPEHRRR